MDSTRSSLRDRMKRLFRVLIGPLPDPDAFRQAMVAVDALDLATFARKYQSSSKVNFGHLLN